MADKKKKKQTEKSTAKSSARANKSEKKIKAKSTAKPANQPVHKKVDKQSSINKESLPKSAKKINPELIKLAKVLEEERIIKNHTKRARTAMTKEKEKELIAQGVDKTVAKVMAKVFYDYNL